MPDRDRTDRDKFDYWAEGYGNMDGRTARDRWRALMADKSTGPFDILNYARWLFGLIWTFLVCLMCLLGFGGVLGYALYRSVMTGGTVAEFPWLIGVFFFGSLIATLMVWLKVRDLW